MRTGAGLWVRAELRRRRRSLVLLTVLCGVVVAVVLTAVAGARRTTTAYDRFLAEGRAGHVDVQMIAGLRGRSDVDLGNGRTAEDVVAELRRLPIVEGLSYGAALQLMPDGLDFYTAASLDGHAINRPRVLDGRLPRGLEEMALSRQAGEVLGKRVGDELEMHGWAPRQAERLMLEGDTSVLREEPGGPRVTLRVVGLVETPGDIGRVDLSGPYGMVSADFYRRHRDEIAQFGPVVSVRLTNGYQDLPALRAAVERLVGASDVVALEDKRTDVDAVNDALDVQALALLLFAGVAAAAGLVTTGTAVTRQLAASGADSSVLEALGLTRRQRTLAVAMVASPVVGGGVLAGFAGAVAASPLLPLGLGGRAEPDPGLAFDAVALPVGAAVLAVVLAGIVVVAAWQASRAAGGGREAAARQEPAWVDRWISSAGFGAVGATGLRLAFDPGPRTRPAPTRAALAAAVFATAAVAAVLVFGASLAKLVAEPALSGFPWHAAAGGGETLEDAAGTVAAVVEDPAVEAVTVAELTETVVAGESTQLLGTRAAKGSAGLTLLDGRAPAAPDEVAVGPATLERTGKGLSDLLALATEDGGSRRYRIVGTAAFPILNSTEYDNGVWLAAEGLAGLQASGGNAVVLIRLSPEGDTAAGRSELEQLGFDFENAAAPAKIANLDEARGFPQALAVFLAVLGVVTVGHALTSSPRRRRRELAVLRTLGLVRRQVRATLAVQATAVSVVGLVVGLPIGIAAGRVVWDVVAGGLSVVRAPRVPPSVLLIPPAAVVLANLMAVLPGRRAAAVHPAEILRAE